MKTTKKFHDLKTGILREIGSVFTVREKRGKYLIELGYVEEIEEVKQAAE